MKIGRNDPCPCGSGKKYKKCCLDKHNNNIKSDISLQFAKLQAKQKQRQKQQGLGRPIMSSENKEYRFVVVGNGIYFLQKCKWKTFHDFLLDYIKFVFGKEWGEGEFKKPYDDQHPVLQWHELVCKYMRERQNKGIINADPMTGAMSAYLNLSYNLYLLAHHFEEKVQAKLIRKLKRKDQFQGALYETYVAALFILAGFKLEMEDEDDSRSSHCEFTAISQDSNEKYSVEAKARQPYKKNVVIGNQLYKALRKKATYKRVVFIDVNVPDLIGGMRDIMNELKGKEANLIINKKPAPAAYVFITNHSYAYDLNGNAFERMGFAYGFKIDGFNIDTEFSNIRKALVARNKHKDMESLIVSSREHSEIPSTFNGEIPEFAFNKVAGDNRLLIGNKYIVPADSQEKEAVLVNAIVAEQEKKIWGIYQLNNGKQITCSNPMTDGELQAYKKYPDTFFGVSLKQRQKINDPLELFDFFYGNYKNCSREKLLGFLKDRKDFEALKDLSNEDLLITCCDALVQAALNR